MGLYDDYLDDNSDDDSAGSQTADGINIHPAVAQYLKELQAKQKNMLAPAYQEKLAQVQTENSQANAQPQMIAAYAKALSGIGTLRGKSSDASAVSDAAKAIDAQRMDQEKQNALANQSFDKQTGLQASVLNHLNDKYMAAQTSRMNTQDRINAQKEMSANDQKNKIELSQLAADNRANQGQGKVDLSLDKRFTEFGKDLNEGLASGRTDMGLHQRMVSSADRVLQLGEQAKHQKGGLDKRQIHELAIASAGLVGGGGTGAAQSTIEALVPHSAQGSIASLEEWLTASPQGTNQQEFVNRMLETADREKHLAQEKLKSIKAGVLQMYGDLKNRDPERYENFVKTNFGDKPQFDQNGKYVMQDYVNPQGPAAGSDGATAYAGTAAPMPVPAGKVRVQSPDGQTFLMPQENLDKALTRGFKKVP